MARKVFGRDMTVEQIASIIPVPPGFTMKYDTFDAGPRQGAESLTVGATIYDDKGRKAGDISRAYMLVDGRRQVYHDIFFLKPEYQGKGIAKNVVEGALPNYRKLGFDSVVLSAHYVGRYAWAKAGFDWASDSEQETKRKEMEAWFAKPSSPKPKSGDYAMEAERLTKTAPGLATSPFGKMFLLDEGTSPWTGELKL